MKRIFCDINMNSKETSKKLSSRYGVQNTHFVFTDTIFVVTDTRKTKRPDKGFETKPHGS